MGIGVLILGASGSGKSTSLRNCTADRFGIVNVQGKPLPFRTTLKTLNTDHYGTIYKALEQSKTPSIVIDDSQYLMANEFMRRARETGYQKFTDIGRNYWDLIETIKRLPDNKIIYLMQHTDRAEDGHEKAKTIGKMLDEKICIEGCFTIVLKAVANDDGYFFKTKTNGFDTVKTPMGMFASEQIDNDVVLVDDIIRDYYNIKGGNETE